MVYLVEGRLKITTGLEQTVLEGEGLAIVPPSVSVIAPEQDTAFMQVVTDSETVARLAGDAGLYDDGAPEVKPTAEWPMPTDGYRLRTYRLADIDASGGMVNACRTRKLMVVPYDRFLEPRDETALTPHSHADSSRPPSPWKGTGSTTCARPGQPTVTTRAPTTIWRSASPSTTIIPAGVVHTSQGVAGEGMRLVDVFSPPRVDFSLRPAWSATPRTIRCRRS